MAILCILTLVNFALSDNFNLPHHLFFYIVMNIRKDIGQGIEACLVSGKNWPLTCVQTLASYLFMRMLSLLLYSSSHGIWTLVVAIQVFSANDFVTNNTCESYLQFYWVLASPAIDLLKLCCVLLEYCSLDELDTMIYFTYESCWQLKDLEKDFLQFSI